MMKTKKIRYKVVEANWEYESALAPSFIKIIYKKNKFVTSINNYYKTKKCFPFVFRTVEFAKRFAHKWKGYGILMNPKIFKCEVRGEKNKPNPYILIPPKHKHIVLDKNIRPGDIPEGTETYRYVKLLEEVK